MSTAKKPTEPAKKLPSPRSRENSTDATRGEPLAVRAKQRRAELATALDKLDDDDVRARMDIELALSSVDGLLTGDSEHLSAATAVDLNRWLERNKHVAETTPVVPRRGPPPTSH